MALLVLLAVAVTVGGIWMGQSALLSGILGVLIASAAPLVIVMMRGDSRRGARR